MVVVAHDHDDGDTMVGQRLQAFGKDLLLGRCGVCRPVCVAAKEEEVNVFFQPAPDHELEGALEVLQAGVEPGGGVEAAVRVAAEVNVGSVENLHAFEDANQEDL